jgi:hypothetical protein
MKSLSIAIFCLLITSNAFAIDSFDQVKYELSIPKVQVGANFYRDVKIKIGVILSLDTIKATEIFDVYDKVKNQLLIASVTVGSATYKNVIITVDQVLEVGGIIDAAEITNSSSFAVTTLLTIN